MGCRAESGRHVQHVCGCWGGNKEGKSGAWSMKKGVVMWRHLEVI